MTVTEVCGGSVAFSVPDPRPRPSCTNPVITCFFMTTNDSSFHVSNGSYSAAWRHYRLWSWAFWIGFAAYLPALALVSRALGGNREDSGNTIFAAAFVWMMIWCAIGYQKFNFCCPRCGELFFNKFDDRPWRMVWRHNPFARDCVHCALPKGAAQEPAICAGIWQRCGAFHGGLHGGRPQSIPAPRLRRPHGVLADG